MKKHILVCAALAAVLTAGACGNAQKTAETSAAAAATETTTTTTTAAETTTTTTTTAAETATTTTTTAAETAPQEAPADAPDKLYIDQFVDERFRDRLDSVKAANEEFMRTNRFIDYKFIYSPETSDIPADVQERAVKCAAESESCISGAEQLKDDLAKGIEVTFAAEHDYFGNTDADAYFQNGEVVPKFVAGWEYDFDGDGSTERFLAVAYPFNANEAVYIFQTALVYENSSGEMSVVDRVDHLNDDIAAMLDYGDFKQFFLNGHGYMGASEHTTLFGVVDGECREMLGIRGGFRKQGCFLSYSGWQGISQFMIYDTTAHDYRFITGYPADVEKLKAYDPDDVIVQYEIDPESDTALFYIFGGRYVLDTGNLECYKYENGRFTKCEYDSADFINVYPLYKSVYDEDGWFDVDFDTASEKSGADLTDSE